MVLIEDVSINNEYEYENENDFNVLEVVFSASMLAMTPSSSSWNCVGNIAFGCFSSTSKAVFYIKHNIRNVQDDKERLETKRNCIKRSEFTFENQLFPVVLPTSSFW